MSDGQVSKEQVSGDQSAMEAAGVTADRRMRNVVVTINRRRQPTKLPAWAGTQSRLSTRSDEARQRRRQGEQL